MLYLDITGKAPKRRCKKVVEWFKAKYMPNHHLDITVAHRGLKREHAQGFCTVMDCDHRPREFLIEMELLLRSRITSLFFYMNSGMFISMLMVLSVISVVCDIGRMLILILLPIKINPGSMKQLRWR